MAEIWNYGSSRWLPLDFLGNETQRINVVGLSYNVISERIMKARSNLKLRKISIVPCFAPTKPDDDKTKDQFNSQHDLVPRSLPKGDIKLVMGCFNAKDIDRP
ncbi:uncharacterized protein LOC131995275 [Stomoxys calcitrans]|uniref:uncharacterized protein LOC131995275 n=1 Tax=Stomoxys calcitrans TaxID=35570 RepID=UPI0027E28088|nr:uncharacterized protein LOC131995275 [Stomoxys calcitrans]